MFSEGGGGYGSVKWKPAWSGGRVEVSNERYDRERDGNNGVVVLLQRIKGDPDFGFFSQDPDLI